MGGCARFTRVSITKREREGTSKGVGSRRGLATYYVRRDGNLGMLDLWENYVSG